jgi:GT2 family glycosyltransferase
MYLEVLNYQPARERHSIRILAYARAADQLLAQGDTREARRQLRHVFNFVSHEMSRSVFFSGFLTVAEAMEKVYRALGETKGAAEFCREGRMFSASAFPDEPATSASPRAPISSPSLRSGELAKPRDQRARRNGGSAPKLDFSVIVPAYNRAAVLRECLSALARQSISPHRFEVIVVDDGSTDETRELCTNHKPRHAFQYLYQENAGAGAARRLGVDHAHGKYLLLINDDAIASPKLLARHLEAHRSHGSEKLAVLGGFKYPEGARKRALTWFLSRDPFLFPQVTLKPGIYATNSFFVTCNISVRRDLVLEAGSFDPSFRVGEDTDLGIRLIQKGLRILYFPEAEAIHQHLDFTIADLVRRAEVYGNQLVRLYEKHPSLLVEGREPFGNLDSKSLKQLRLYIEEHESDMPGAIESLAKFDSIDFLPYFSKEIDGKNAAEQVMNLFAQSIPTVYWHRLFCSFLAARGAATPAESSVNRHLVAS